MTLHSFEKNVPIPGTTITTEELRKRFPITPAAEAQLAEDLSNIAAAERQAAIDSRTAFIGYAGLLGDSLSQ